MKTTQYLLASAMCALPFAASAADLPMKAPPYRVVQPVPFTWTGFYIGASGGFVHQGTTATNIDTLFFPHGTTFGVDGTGGLFGVNVGYNYQMGAIVLGLEADIAGSTLNNTSNALGVAGTFFTSSKLTSLGTVRGRIGYTFDRALLYATGGFAYGHVENTFNFPIDPNSTSGLSTSGTKTGWTVGGGLEYAITNNWTVRAEGLYVDLGKSTSGKNCSGCRFGFKNTYGLGRVGLNYKF
jgi:outer membrane immunogenic protein